MNTKEAQEFKSSGVRELKSLGVQEFRSSTPQPLNSQTPQLSNSPTLLIFDMSVVPLIPTRNARAEAIPA
jgi:hypothetical protein